MKCPKTLPLFLILTLILSGCADVKSKFIRKKKEEEAPFKKYYAVRPYDVRPNADLYAKRYSFWKIWHDELLAVLSDSNKKKAAVAVEQSISNLMDMQNMLNDEKAPVLQKFIDEMTRIEKEIKNERITLANEVRMRKDLEHLGKKVRVGFNYKDIKPYLADRFRSGTTLMKEDDEEEGPDDR